jgi:hypothetical protein
MRFTTIEGTEVTVKVNSPQEAKSAIKELRHRKKEIGLHRRALLRLERAAQKERARRERHESTEARRRRSLLASLARAAGFMRANKPRYDLDAIESELHQLDDTLHNIDVCIVQIEGKLLLHS